MSSNLEEGNNNDNDDKLYPQGIHVSLWKLPNNDVRKRLAMVLRNPLAQDIASDNINSIEILPEDDRVAYVETCGHGFFFLTKHLNSPASHVCQFNYTGPDRKSSASININQFQQLRSLILPHHTKCNR
jgi:hypothetical protein